MSNHAALVEDALRRFREEAEAGRPTVDLFRCQSKALEAEIEQLRAQLAGEKREMRGDGTDRPWAHPGGEVGQAAGGD